ncbi:glycine oxidase [Rhizobium rosettiformans]|uniref:FAD-binding oxidoreductase n=2 Tax=Rhizobium rosettiformans TaxID=1368430 RepID=A0A4S8PVE6_9HYPH|nr:FAD-binding oxidoreductase [Rhizobium rosettiformans]MBB5276615.1 glycine oxidase [Rhizobium rosettiformans]THV35533.1 FAD-binding oxidoreductase [Rhizobium rosettiformans W3]
MAMSDKTAAVSGQLRAELVIVGGGIMGLWAALKADRRGIDTILIDGAGIASGASGGLLGALMAHMPDRWNEKKQLQFEGLLTLEAEIAAVEAESGLSTGYRRCGRLIPLPKPHLRPLAERHSDEAQTNWDQSGRRFDWSVTDESPFTDWPSRQFSEAGIVLDSFAGRVSPRGLMASIRQLLARSRHVRVIEGQAVRSIDAAARSVALEDGSAIGFGDLLVAAGVGSFPLLEMVGPELGKSLGRGVKGQAALLKADLPDDLPLLYLDGLYVVPHEGGRVAIGSTSENRYDDPFSTDTQLDALIAEARELAPVLREAEVLERWAGLRPKAIDRDPMVGPHPDHPHVHALTGGFKVSFGIAHLLADAVLDSIAGKRLALPHSFSLTHHVSVAARRANDEEIAEIP